ncbi:hypothetical protein [Dongia sp. agr-C8]
MAWQQIAGLVLLTLIVLVCLWPRGRRSGDNESQERDGQSGGGPGRGGFHGGGGIVGGAGVSAHWSDSHGGADGGGHD